MNDTLGPYVALIVAVAAMAAGTGFTVGLTWNKSPTCRTCVERCAPFPVASCTFAPVWPNDGSEKAVCGCATSFDGGTP